MKLTAEVKLLPTPQQAQLLRQTIEAANVLCDAISEFAWKHKVFSKFKLQKLCYLQMRATSHLSSQMVIRCYSKVADAYKLDKQTKRKFRKYGAVAYDGRILSWHTHKHFVSIWSIGGRLQIPYQAGKRQRELLQHHKGESDLIYRKNDKTFYLLATCEFNALVLQETEGMLGIDLGIVNIAADSDGDSYTGKQVERNRQKMQNLRSSLQSRGSMSAKRHLRKLATRQKRFQKDINHVISKRLVEKAQRTNRAIGLEDLTGICLRTRAKGAKQRARRSNWSFYQLRQYIAYKAQLVGLPVVIVDPRYTSQQCSRCGFVNPSNRHSQSEFLCLSCGHAEHADVNAARNIAIRAACVMQPIVSEGTYSTCARDKLLPFGAEHMTKEMYKH